jgi:hypothetical protein
LKHGQRIIMSTLPNHCKQLMAASAAAAAAAAPAAHHAVHMQLPLAVVAVFVFGFGGLGGDIALWSLAVILSAVLGLRFRCNSSSRCSSDGVVADQGCRPYSGIGAAAAGAAGAWRSEACSVYCAFVTQQPQQQLRSCGLFSSAASSSSSAGSVLCTATACLAICEPTNRHLHA